MKKHRWSDEELEFIRIQYKTHTAAQLAPIVNEKFGTNIKPETLKKLVYNKKLDVGERTYSTKFSPQEIDFLLQEYQQHDLNALSELAKEKFGKSVNPNYLGQLFFSRGVKSPHRGNKPNGSYNALPIGAERTKIRHGRTYVLVKVAKPNIWRLKSHIAYEKHFPGETVRPGEAILFRDNNTFNFSKNNLLKLSRRELTILVRSGYSSADIGHRK